MAQRTPFADVEEIRFEAGATLAEILEAVQPVAALRAAAEIRLGADRIAPALWPRVRPKPGTLVNVFALPQGGGDGKNPLAVLLQIAIVAASIYVPGLAPVVAALGELGAAALGAGIAIVGSLAVNAIFPAARPRLPQLSGQTADSPTHYLTGIDNQLRPFGIVPWTLGRHRIVPNLGAPFYTEIAGDDQYLRFLLDCGIGPLRLEDGKSGETPLANFEGIELEIRLGYRDDQLTDKGSWDAASGSYPAAPSFGDWYTASVAGSVGAESYAVGETIVWNGMTDLYPGGWDRNGNKPLTLFPGDVTPDESLGVLLLEAESWTVRTTAVDTDEISVDHSYLQGLVTISSSGNKKNRTVVTEVQYSPEGEENWVSPPVAAGGGANGTIATTARSTAAVRSSLRWKVARGQYDVRSRRVTADTGSTQISDKVTWTALRSFSNEDPLSRPNACKIAGRVKRSDELHGVLSRINFVATTICEDWDSGQQSWITRPTRNCASLARYVLQIPGVFRKTVPDSGLILGGAGGSFEAFHEDCTANGYRFDGVVDYRTQRGDILAMICGAGRALLYRYAGRRGIEMDRAGKLPVQLFAPRNLWGFSTGGDFLRFPHALRCRFVNEQKGWQQDVATIFADGFDESNATRYEDSEAPGLTDPDLVWKDQRYRYYDARRRETEGHSFFTDRQALAVKRRGLVVLVGHDAILVGLASGDVAAVTTDGGGDITALTLDKPVTMEAGKSYGLQVRVPGASGSGVALDMALVALPGESATVTLQEAIPAATPALLKPRAQDLWSFGETEAVTERCIVRAIEPSGLDQIKIAVKPEAPEVYLADSGTVPPHVSNLSIPPGLDVPAVVGARSDESVMVQGQDGSWQNRIVLTLERPGVLGRHYAEIEARQRPEGSDAAWIYPPPVEADAGAIALFPVEQGDTVEYQLRYVLADRRTRGDWSAPATHTVLGKTAPPPQPTGFLVERLPDGTRRYSATMPLVPFDLAGWKLYARSGTWGTFADLQAFPLNKGGVISALPYESNELAKGTWTVAITAVDSSENESTAAFVTVTLGDPRLGGVIVGRFFHEEGWPEGTLEDCFRFGDSLLALAAVDIDGLVGDIAAQPATIETFGGARSPIAYETPVIDLGAEVSFTPLVTALGVGAITTTMKTGTAADGTAVGVFGALGLATGKRYVQLRVEAADAGAPRLDQLAVLIDGEKATQEFPDVDTSAETASWFQSTAAGHFKIGSRGEMASITQARIDAIQAVGPGWSWELIAKNGTVNGEPAAEFKVYDAGGTLADAIVDVTLKGPKE